MPNVPWHLIEHSLNVSKITKPIKQKLRRFTHDKKEAIRVEVTWLLVARFIKEVYHPEWPTRFLYAKRIMNGECVSIILISTNTALKTPSAYLA
jgi:hypothetical protein